MWRTNLSSGFVHHLGSTRERPNLPLESTLPITLTINISHPDVVTGDARTALYNSVAQTLEVLGPEWTHRCTSMTNGNLLINFYRNRAA